HQQKTFGSTEAVAQFAAQFKLFSQSITHALGLSNTPERCEEQLARTLVQLEEIEGQFSEYDQFLADIMNKREEIYESFQEHKQRLLDERQKRAQSIFDAATRILNSIEKRSLGLTKADELNTYFASDALVLKIRDLVEQLRQLDNAVKADDLDARFKAIRGQALRALRDKTDIFEDGGNVIKLGPRHRFNVNTQELDLTIIPREGELNIHLTGTNYYEPLQNPELLALRDYWNITQESETPQVYRAEYLASLILNAAREQRDDLSIDVLHTALLDDEQLQKLVREFAAPRYKEGYQKGIHDHDAALLLKELIPALDRADLLSFDPLSRALAQIFWANLNNSYQRKPKDAQRKDPIPFDTWKERAQSAKQMVLVFGSLDALSSLIAEVADSLGCFISQHPLPVSTGDIKRAAQYLVEELARERLEFISSKYARQLADELKNSLDEHSWRQYQGNLEKMLGWPAERWQLSTAWLQALVKQKGLAQIARY